MLYTWNQHDVVHQLYLNLEKNAYCFIVCNSTKYVCVYVYIHIYKHIWKPFKYTSVREQLKT